MDEEKQQSAKEQRPSWNFSNGIHDFVFGAAFGAGFDLIFADKNEADISNMLIDAACVGGGMALGRYIRTRRIGEGLQAGVPAYAGAVAGQIIVQVAKYYL